jgi:TPR repeat protein
MFRKISPIALAASLMLIVSTCSLAIADAPQKSDKDPTLIDCGDFPGTAQFQKAWANEQGVGVPINMIEAIRLYRAAADLGNPLAKGRLARIYFGGNGVPEDKGAAEQLSKGIFPDVSKAAAGNIAVAQLVLASMYDDGLGVERDQQEALKWLRKAADQNLAVAQLNMGVTYEHGLGVPRDLKQAVQWYRKAADGNSAGAQGYLGDMYYFGKGMVRDDCEAVKWYRKGAEKGDAHAQNNLGVMFDNGCGVPQDHCEAAKWFRKSAEQSFVIGERNLAAMYERGCGVPCNLNEAVKWYRKAAAQGDDESVQKLKCLGYEP